MWSTVIFLIRMDNLAEAMTDWWFDCCSVCGVVFVGAVACCGSVQTERKMVGDESYAFASSDKHHHPSSC
jgi:hypothetical protein